MPGLLIWEFLGPLQGTNRSLSRRDERDADAAEQGEDRTAAPSFPAAPAQRGRPAKGQRADTGPSPASMPGEQLHQASLGKSAWPLLISGLLPSRASANDSLILLSCCGPRVSRTSLKGSKQESLTLWPNPCPSSQGAVTLLPLVHRTFPDWSLHGACCLYQLLLTGAAVASHRASSLL